METVDDVDREQYPVEPYLYHRVIAGMTSKVREYPEQRHLVKRAGCWSQLSFHLDNVSGGVPAHLRERLDLLPHEILPVQPTTRGVAPTPARLTALRSRGPRRRC